MSVHGKLSWPVENPGIDCMVQSVAQAPTKFGSVADHSAKLYKLAEELDLVMIRCSLTDVSAKMVTFCPIIINVSSLLRVHRTGNSGLLAQRLAALEHGVDLDIRTDSTLNHFSQAFFYLWAISYGLALVVPDDGP